MQPLAPPQTQPINILPQYQPLRQGVPNQIQMNQIPVMSPVPTYANAGVLMRDPATMYPVTPVTFISPPIQNNPPTRAPPDPTRVAPQTRPIPIPPQPQPIQRTQQVPTRSIPPQPLQQTRPISPQPQTRPISPQPQTRSIPPPQTRPIPTQPQTRQ